MARPLPLGAPPGLSAAVRPLLRLAAEQAGLDGCLLSRRQGDRWVVLESSDDAGLLPVGACLPWEDTLCAASVSGRAPQVVPDVAADPVLAPLAARYGVPLGAWVSLPLRDADGTLLGTLCGLSGRPLGPELLDRAALLQAVAVACAGLLGADLALTASRAAGVLQLPDVEDGPASGLLHVGSWEQQVRLHDARCADLGATCSALVLEVRDARPGPDVLLAVQAVLGEGDAATRLPAGPVALLLVDAGPREAAERGEELGRRLVAAGVGHRWGLATAGPGRPLPAAVHAAVQAAARAPWRLAPDRPTGTGAGRLRALLEQLRTQLGQEVAFVSELTGSEQVFREVVAPAGFPCVPGDRRPEDGSLCRRILDGALPAVMSDVAQHAAARDVDVVQAGLVRSYLAAPVRLSDGRLYGTLCALSSRPTPGLSSRDAVVLQVVADAVAVEVEAALEATSERRQVHDALEAVLSAGGPQAVYQPVVATGDLQVVGVEALTRFPDGRGPLAWFLEAARHGRGVELELAACRQAVGVLPGLAASGRFLSVNLSPAALRDPGSRALFDDVAARGLLGALVVEVTEHEQVDDYDVLVDLLGPWRQRGLRLAVDDTGAGHASLRHVLLLEPEIIKLDRELVTSLESDRTRADLVAALAAFAARSGRALVAEGVETAAELHCLTRLGVGLVQGYHLARPRPEVVTELVLPGGGARRLGLPRPRPSWSPQAALP